MFGGGSDLDRRSRRRGVIPFRLVCVAPCPVPRGGVACAVACLRRIRALLLVVFGVEASLQSSWDPGQNVEGFVHGVETGTLSPMVMALVAR